MLQKMIGCSLINCIISTRYNVNLTFQRVPVDNFKVSKEEKPFPIIRTEVSVFARDILSDLRYLPAIRI